LAAPVNVVTEEEVIRAWRILTVVKETEEILELSVDISTDRERRLEFEENRLIQIDLTGFLAEPDNLDA
jgi:hypothetical protein